MSTTVSIGTLGFTSGLRVCRVFVLRSRRRRSSMPRTFRGPGQPCIFIKRDDLTGALRSAATSSAIWNFASADNGRATRYCHRRAGYPIELGAADDRRVQVGAEVMFAPTREAHGRRWMNGRRAFGRPASAHIS